MSREFLAQMLRVLICISWIGISGCGEDPQQIFDTAQFEEKQGNQAHAIELYEHVIEISPESEWGKQERERLAEFRK